MEAHIKAPLYPNEELRNKLVELGIPRWKHNLAELGEMLPKFTRSFKEELTFNWRCELLQANGYMSASGAETEADARAKLLIYLIENKLVQ